ncbi:MAG: tetratricopeptide repeat protein [Flavobacteriaceae bacterium]|nr:tetratricopeptide repeat protein [Flavobacteriaceae bacterium]NNK55245.1 tetratricopeptide repeat protein [Flavobacteriaceae bacterium]
MSHLKKLSTFIMMIALLLVISCKSSEESKVTFPENDIPIGETSQEALKEFMEGLKLYDQGDFIKSRPHFRKAIELDPDFVSGHMYTAYTSNSVKDWSENRDKFLAMRDKANEAEIIMMDLIEADLDNDTAKELELSKALVEKYPNSARAMDNLAGYYVGMDEVEKAREHWMKAHELDQDFIPVISSLGASYLFTSPKDFNKAEKYMQMVVDKLPESSQARIGLGDCYRAQGDLGKALASYKKAAELDTENEVAHSKAGHANTFMGNYELARQNFKDARKVSEFGTGSYNFEAYTYLYEGDYKKALAFLQEGAEMFDKMDIPESNKNGAKMGCARDCAMIAMHYGDADHLKELVAMMKPMSNQFSEEADDPITTLYQKANMHYWDAMASVTEGDYEAAAAKADMIKAAMETVNDPNKLRSYHRVHAFVNYKKGDYDKALEHMAELNEDNVYIKFWKAKAHKMKGNDEKSMELFKEIANNNFNSVAYALILNQAKEMTAAVN